MLRRLLVSLALAPLLLASSAQSQPEVPAPLKGGPPAEFRIEFRQPDWRELNFHEPNAADLARKCADKANFLGYEVHLENYKDRSRVAWRMLEWMPYATVYKLERAEQLRTWLQGQGLETRLAEPRPAPPVEPRPTPSVDPRPMPPVEPKTADPVVPTPGFGPFNPGFGPRKQFFPPKGPMPQGVRPGEPPFGFQPPQKPEEPRGPAVVTPPMPGGPKQPEPQNFQPFPNRDPAFGFPPPMPQEPKGPATLDPRFQERGFQPFADPSLVPLFPENGTRPNAPPIGSQGF